MLQKPSSSSLDTPAAIDLNFGAVNMSSQMDPAIAASVQAGENLHSPVSPLSPSLLSHEAQGDYSPVAANDLDVQEHVNATQVLPNSSALTNTAHGSAHVGSGIRESQPEAGLVPGEAAQAQVAQNIPGSGETNVVMQSAGERPTL
jgi:uncharacterized protein involved in copper resistance